MPVKPPLRIVYVVGRSHSGSTLLDLLVSSHSEIASVGEAKMFQRQPAKACTCGAPSWSACPLWSAVDRSLREASAPPLAEIRIDSGDADTFARHNGAFFAAVSQVTGKQVLLDSSKDLSRLKRLLASDVPVEVIHLLRHPCGVTYSNLRKGGDLARECRRYVRTHLGAARATVGRRSIEVHYETLASAPREELERIMGWLGLAFEPAQLAGWKRRERHNFGGNRMRFDASEEIRVDDTWRRGLTAVQKARIVARTLPARFRAGVGLRAMHGLFGGRDRPAGPLGRASESDGPARPRR